MTNGSLMKVKSIAECILQYFWPALSDNWSWKQISGLFESVRFTQVWLCFTQVLLCFTRVLLYHVRAHLYEGCSESSDTDVISM